ncbi:MAG: (2Fe-2S)-binding protein [Gaiellaceae bacterium]|jgi:carbon-monoxide dehydrogenase small subunit
MTGRTYSVSLTVNGRPHTLDVPAHHTLLRALREQLDLVGTKECCTEGECGACTVLVDGQAVDSCLMLAVEAAGAEITTIEGLADGDRLDPLQAAFLETGAVQCGFCTPGMIMTARYLLAQDPHPTRAAVQEGISGNLCRCGGYNRIVDAVLAAAEAESS